MERETRLAGDVFARICDDRATQRAVARGAFERLRRGTAVDSGVWRGLDERWRHIIRATALMHSTTSRLVLSHETAAAMWGFPDVKGWPADVHVIDLGRTTSKRTPGLVRHSLARPRQATIRWGVPTTGALDTAIDAALSGGFLRALVLFDHGLRRGLFRPEELAAELSSRGPARGIRQALVAARLAGPGSENAGESLSKGGIHLLGFDPPEQQRAFPNPRGKDYRVDFWWEQHGIIGELDGKQKYLDEAMRSGRTIEQVILDEKRREDDLRARPEVRNLVRWSFEDARRLPILRRILVTAGLPEPLETPATRQNRRRRA